MHLCTVRIQIDLVLVYSICQPGEQRGQNSRDIDNNKCFSAILLAAQVHLWAQTVCTLKLCYHKAKAMGWSAEIIQTGEFKSAAKATMFKSEVDVNFPKHFGWVFFHCQVGRTTEGHKHPWVTSNKSLIQAGHPRAQSPTTAVYQLSPGLFGETGHSKFLLAR